MSNFLFSSKEENSPLKVIDFGLSNFVKPDERLNDIVGSVYYVAPEAEPRFDEAPWPTLSAEAKDFVKRLLNKDYHKRMTASHALSHPSIRDAQQVKIPLDMIIYKLMRVYISSSSLRKSALRALVKNSTDAMNNSRVIDFVTTSAFVGWDQPRTGYL
ncbi:hypothetical protein ZWY2020_021553 [Hordeum vulgare]|nr:hypothetical protein ZWY2020_021553 [Hordeum vulgare]